MVQKEKKRKKRIKKHKKRINNNDYVYNKKFETVFNSGYKLPQI